MCYVNHARKCYAFKMQSGGTNMQKLGVLCAICRKLGAMWYAKWPSGAMYNKMASAMCYVLINALCYVLCKTPGGAPLYGQNVWSDHDHLSSHPTLLENKVNKLPILLTCFYTSRCKTQRSGNDT